MTPASRDRSLARTFLIVGAACLCYVAATYLFAEYFDGSHWLRNTLAVVAIVCIVNLLAHVLLWGSWNRKPQPGRKAGEEDLTRCAELLRSGKRTKAIKHYRQATGAGLPEAKEQIELMEGFAEAQK